MKKAFFGNLSRTSGLFLALIAVASMALVSGCGVPSKLGTQTVQINYYPACYRPITDVRASAQKVREDTATGAAMGAAVGAAAGLARSGSLRGALIGGVTGAIVGGVGTYLVSSSIQDQVLNERFRSYNSSMTQNMSRLQNAVKAARLATDCYDKAYRSLKKSYQKGAIGKAEMLARLKEIRDGSNDARQILLNYKDEAANNIKTYQEVVRLENTRSRDRAPARTVNSFKKQVTTYESTSKNLNSTVELLNTRVSLYDSDLQQLSTADNGPVNLSAESEVGPEAVCTSL